MTLNPALPALAPDGSTVTRTVQVGGLTKADLLHALQRNAVALNGAAEQLLASEHFAPTMTRTTVQTVEVTVGELGFPQGALVAAIYAHAATLGLQLCPVELGPYLRLHYLDQPEGYGGQPERPHQAPPGSLTIASAPLVDDDEFPKGFYLRCIQGVQWLRGYCSGADHLWAPDDHFIFAI